MDAVVFLKVLALLGLYSVALVGVISLLLERSLMWLVPLFLLLVAILMTVQLFIQHPTLLT
jgi:hypothetical protein